MSQYHSGPPKLLSNNPDGSDGGPEGPTIEEIDPDVDYKAVIDALADEKLQESLSRVKASATDEDSDVEEVVEVSEEQKAAFVKLHTDMQRLSRRIQKAGWVEVKHEAAKGRSKEEQRDTLRAKQKGKVSDVEKDTKKAKRAKRKTVDGKLHSVFFGSVAMGLTALCLKG